MAEHSDDTFNAFMDKYSRIYNPEANDRALLEMEAAAERRKAANVAEVKPRRPACE